LRFYHRLMRCFFAGLPHGVVVPLAGGAAALGHYLSLALVLTTLVITPMRRPQTGTPMSAHNLAYEDVSFTARNDGVALSGWFIPARNSERVIVFVHGKDSCRSCEFSNGALDFAFDMHERGFNMFMFDLRGHGQSSAARVSFGLREKNDVLGAVDWLLAKGFMRGEIGVLGVSLGSASATYAAAEEPAIGALVIDSGFADFGSLAGNMLRRTSGSAMLLTPALSAISTTLAGVDGLASQPVAQIPRILPRPIMVIHGADDRLIPPAQAEQLARAAHTDVWLVAGANHARTYRTLPVEYTQRVATFFDNSLQ
jgi:pimeloyl-ACP methyl ester carboxylesterase